MAQNNERGGVQSVAVAAAILKSLAAAGGELPLKGVAAATGMPRAKVHRYLASLRGADLIAQDPETGHYRIGSAAIGIGLVGLGHTSPVRQVQDVLPHLRDAIGETVTAAIWGDHGPTIVAMEESDHPVTMNVRMGSVLPLLSSVIGRVFLAFMPETTTRPFVAAERRARGSAVPSKAELETLLADIRQQRVCWAHSPLLPGVDAVAAPVFEYRGKLAAVICAVGRTEVMRIDGSSPVVTALETAARELSRRLGYAGEPLLSGPANGQ
ncbi:MAG TPA: IclR family transcriptional regulator [Hyphomicrobiaceae bacterium]|jgi:DNA-binding IclR family transcriptional regulator|nr:IclR family transcriptional regulator [Hyphomicrobiaceae bacterium]